MARTPIPEDMIHRDNQNVLEEALDNERQMNEISDRQGDLLDPILDRAPDMDDEELVWWIKHMPGGFHRAEMRGIIRRRKGDEWMVEQGLSNPVNKI